MDEFLQTLTFFASSHQLLGQGPPPGYRYSNLYEYVLKEGRPMESKALSAEQLKYIQKLARGGSYPLKQCFSNSQILIMQAEEDGRLAYYEGYASTGIMPTLHGWLVLDGECLIDMTWRQGGNLKPARGPLHRTRVFGEIPKGYSYYGLEVASRAEIRKQAVSTGMWQTFLDDYQNDYPKLREPKAA